jgi:hypothetical protein
MGMFSEIHASIEAEGLENALLNAIAINNSNVNDYCKNNILPLYENAVVETWSKPSDNYKIIREFFNVC